jgi:pimeloyl-ACP methyl ester carboxylesterase
MFSQAYWIAGLGVVTSVLADGSTAASTTHTRTVHAGDQDIFCYDHGSGPVLILIHGMFGDFTDWEPILEPLSKSHRVVALDLPGFGASSKPDVEYTEKFFVATLLAVLQELGITKATFVGNSLGGIVCMLFALQHPERVESLVLIGSGGFHDWTEEERSDAQLRFRKDNLRKLSPAIHQRIFTPLFVKGASAISDSYLRKQDAKLSRDDFEQYVHAINSSVQLALDAVLLGRLCEIKSRTLLIQGKQDQVMLLKWAQEAVQRFPCAELKVIADCGHVPQLESGPEVVRMISEFVAKS